MAASKKHSAGILLYRLIPEKTGVSKEPEVFLVHPGGPYWKNKDAGSWTIPKGEFTTEEDPLQAALREFREETGTSLMGLFLPLSSVWQKGGKEIHAWAVSGDLDPATLISNTFDMEWPPRSGKYQSFPEVDKGGWFTIQAATAAINPAQIALLEELLAILSKP